MRYAVAAVTLLAAGCGGGLTGSVLTPEVADEDALSVSNESAAPAPNPDAGGDAG